MGSGKGGDGKIKIYEYSMSMHIGICAYSSGLELLEVKVGGKTAWRGSATARSVLGIVLPQLFGGPSREGGLKGMMHWLPGAGSQRLSAALYRRLGLTVDTHPGFRGIASLFFTGTKDPGVTPPSTDPGEVSGYATLRNNTASSSENTGGMEGFYWGANNPYLRPIAVRVRRPPIGLSSGIAMIAMGNDSQGNAMFAANPAHIIYECFTNTDWGLGEPTAAMDTTTYNLVAQTLYNEGFGLNIMWDRQSMIEEFIDEVLTYIRGAVYVDPTTGLHTIKLLRGDYDPQYLPEINPSNATMSAFKRMTWGDTVNEVIVRLTNPETNSPETVTAQDLAGIAAQGGIASSTREYPGITNRALAQKVAERDLAAAVTPLATCEVSVSRAFWNTMMSDVVRLSWPPYDIDMLVCRVVNVTKSPQSVNLRLVEDIFGLNYANYIDSGGTQWTNPATPPAPLTTYRLGTAPAFMMASALGLNNPGQLDPEEAMSLVLVAPNTPADRGYDLLTYQSNVNGVVALASLGTQALLSTWLTTEDLPAEPETLIPEILEISGAAPSVGDFIMFSSGNAEEIVSVQSITSSGFLLNRGLLDTVPRAWATGTRAWVIPSDMDPADQTQRAIGEEVSYFFRTRVESAILATADAPEVEVTLTNRAHRPNRPANVKVDGQGFGTVDIGSATSITVTWARRNRALESTQIMRWTDADVTPESGQTTTVRLLLMNGTQMVAYTGITGTSQVVTIPADGYSAVTEIRVQVLSTRGGVNSLTAHEILLTRTA